MRKFAHLLPAPPTDKEIMVAADNAIELVHIHINPHDFNFERRVAFALAYDGAITDNAYIALLLILHCDVGLFLRSDAALSLRIFPAHSIVLEKHSYKLLGGGERDS